MNYSEEYNKNGYIILKNLYTSSEVDEIQQIVNDLNIENFEHSKDKTGYPLELQIFYPKITN